MAQDQTKIEALFNEVKGSLFEYLLGKNLAREAGDELSFLKGIDKNYAAVLSQQDRMVRQFYPEMLTFLSDASLLAAQNLKAYLKEVPKHPRLLGKLSNDQVTTNEADLMLETSKGPLPLSIKLNKKNAYVNTKSGGIKSFFTQYFPYLPASIQSSFNQRVDMEFQRMATEIHTLHELEFPGNFQLWVSKGLSELPGEQGAEERLILKRYYARISQEMHVILKEASTVNREAFERSLLPLLGFSAEDILQLICFHDFKSQTQPVIRIHSHEFIQKHLSSAALREKTETASNEIILGPISLQIRVKPMNKFTTTAIKINCSVKMAED
jgi:hypothetical protein